MTASKTGNFFIGCAVYLMIALFGSIGMSVYVRNKTTDRTQESTN